MPLLQEEWGKYEKCLRDVGCTSHHVLEALRRAFYAGAITVTNFVEDDATYARGPKHFEESVRSLHREMDTFIEELEGEKLDPQRVVTLH